MGKFKLTCLALALCGIFAINPIAAQDDGGFDGGDFGGDFGDVGGDFGGYEGDFSGGYEGDYGGGYDAGSYNDDFGDFDQSDAFFQNENFNQPDDNEFGNNPDLTNSAGQEPESIQNSGELAQEPTPTESTDSALETTSAAEPTESTENAGAAESTDTTETGATTQDNTVNVQNTTNIDQNTGHGHHDGHSWGHHYYHDGFGLGFGLGLGLGVLGYGPFGFYGPFAPFGYYGFGVPYSSFAYYGGRYGAGVGIYGNYAGFGPYRYFEPYYPLGGYPALLAATPVFSTPTQAPAYVQRNEATRVAPAQNRNYWHYCRNPEGYYPYVKQCNGEWIKVPPQPS